jgi:hypothetical protein
MAERRKNNRVLLVFAFVVILAGSLFTQNRTMLLGFIVFYVAAQMFVFKKPVKPLIYICFFSFFVFGAFFFLASDNMITLLQKRLFLSVSAGAEIEHALTVGRFGLYVQYLDRLVSTFPFGQGLGLPFSYGVFSQEPTFISDISLVSFSIPFGLLGTIMLFTFFVKLFRSFKRHKKVYPNDISPRIFIWLLFTACIISLNIDIFSRNIFVVYLAVFAVLHYVPSAKKMEKVIE